MRRSFRKPADQARWAAMQLAAHGVSRSVTRHDRAQVSSIGTERTYRDSLRLLAVYQADHRSDLKHATPECVSAWLQERAQVVGQKKLDTDRNAALAWLAKLGRSADLRKADFLSQVHRHGLAEQSRVYTREQVAAIADHQTPSNALATRIAFEAGLRAFELGSIARLDDDQPRSPGRPWDNGRFSGHGNVVVYTVHGKGGLVREVALSRETATELEAHRRSDPVRVTDREIFLTSRYDIGFGQAWSQSFTRASRKALGWSCGGHSARHVYAQSRMDTLQGEGRDYDEARHLVSQEVGHWKTETTNAYLR